MRSARDRAAALSPLHKAGIWAGIWRSELRPTALSIGSLVVVLLLLWGAQAHAVEVQRVVSPGGIEAWLVEDHAVPVLSLHLSFAGGSAADPAGKAGLARMVAALLDEGAGTLDAQGFQQQLADNAIGLSFGAYRDSFTASLKTLNENRDLAFSLLGLALASPRFDAPAVARVREQLLAGLARSASNPKRVAGRTFWHTLYPDHPYGRPGLGEPETVQAITAADLHGFVDRRLARDTVKVGVVGDIDAAALAPLLDLAFDALPRAAAPLAISDVAPMDAPRLVQVEMDIPQSVVVFGQAGIKRDDPDYYAAFVLNYILGGGGFASRLTETVREENGLAYSIYSYLASFQHSAVIAGGLGSRNARVDAAMELLRREWARMAADGPTADELQRAKTYLTGSYPLQFTNTMTIAQRLVAIQRQDLGMDYLDRRNDLIEAVTLDDLRRVAQRLLDPDRLTFVVVGRMEDATALN